MWLKDIKGPCPYQCSQRPLRIRVQGDASISALCHLRQCVWLTKIKLPACGNKSHLILDMRQASIVLLQVCDARGGMLFGIPSILASGDASPQTAQRTLHPFQRENSNQRWTLSEKV